jgi:tetratricopeptide (TPR) repeat protein
MSMGNPPRHREFGVDRGFGIGECIAVDPTPRNFNMDSSPRNIADSGMAEATAAVTSCREAFAGGGQAHLDALVDALKTRADLCWQCGAHEDARADYQETADLLAGKADDGLRLGRALAGLGMVCDALGDVAAAAAHWERAIWCFETCDPPSLLRAAPLANNLGWLRQGMGDYDGAETAYLRALEIFHGQYGFDHEETATVACNLGVLYQLSGHLAQECEMHRIAWEARRKLFGEAHPETAGSCHQLAAALLRAGDRVGARRQFELARDAYRKLGPDFQEMLEAVEAEGRAM